ncbi:DegV family protein [Mycoplasmopsis meleagridis]|uniref:DegV family protein n=1 Tax=Mycoplasmopsis meleagridis TaxID=29561 RepID=UPI003A8BD883
MKKVGFILDSFSCLTQEEANKLGYGYFPFRVDIDNKIYHDGVDLNKDTLLKLIAQGNKVQTSLPSLEIMENVISSMCEEYDMVIYLQISETLSGAMSAANNFTSEYKNFIIIPNRFVADQFLYVIEYIKNAIEKGLTINDIKKKLALIQKDTETYIIPFDLKYLINGGRISNLKKFVLKSVSKMKLLPFIRFHLNENSPAGIARGYKGATTQIISKLLDKVKDHKPFSLLEKFHINFVSGINEEVNNDVIRIFKENKLTFNSVRVNTSVIAVHTGPDAVAVSIMPKIK